MTAPPVRTVAPHEDRAGKWRARAEEWTRLAELSVLPHIADMCARQAAHSQMMADFWNSK